jgi:amyloid beta A4 protein
MSCYTQSLESPEKVVKVQKCLEKLLRILHKDRHHTLSHYRHLLKSNVKQAQAEEDYTLQRLTQIGQTARQAVAMLERSVFFN